MTLYCGRRELNPTVTRLWALCVTRFTRPHGGCPYISRGNWLGIEVIMDLGEVRIPYDPVKDRKAKGEIHD